MGLCVGMWIALSVLAWGWEKTCTLLGSMELEYMAFLFHFCLFDVVHVPRLGDCRP